MKLTCPDCGADMTLRNSRYGQFYGCVRFPLCKAAHGAHPNGKPLGVPATKETKAWRIKAHDAFDAIWKQYIGNRGQSYQWLQLKLGMSAEECHIGRFGIEECQRVIAACEAFDAADLEQLPERKPKKKGYWKRKKRKAKQ